MQNDRPIENPNIQQVINEFQRLCRYYDLAGGCVVLDEKEAGFTYPIYTTWNAIVEDETVVPLGFRIRIKQEEQGVERARQLAEGTAWTFGGLKDFGTQTVAWMTDLMTMMRKAGIGIHHRPFGGKKLPRLSSRP